MSKSIRLLILGVFSCSLVCVQAEYPDPDAREVVLEVHAGGHDRLDVPVSVLVDAPDARSVWIQGGDGKFERAGVVDPGIEHGKQGVGRKELFFGVSDLKKGEVRRLVAKLSPKPVEHRGYLWTGEPRQSRRLSCTPCHQGLDFATANELRIEREVMAATGKPPAMPAFAPLPTTEGKDFRWHKTLGRFQHSACSECHGRQFVEYRFGQTLDPHTKWAPEVPKGSSEEYPGVYYRVFRVKGDQPFSPSAGSPADSPPPGIHFGIGSGLRQQHARILSEEANKFIGRQCVLVNWLDGEKHVVATEERQLTVKNMRASNKSLAIWIDCVSFLHPAAGEAGVGKGESRVAGWRFVFPSDDRTEISRRDGSCWQAATFTAEGHRHTAVCVVSPASGGPALHKANGENSIGFDVPIQSFAPEAQKVRCRLWLQGEDMSVSEVERMAADFQEPVQVEVK